MNLSIIQGRSWEIHFPDVNSLNLEISVIRIAKESISVPNISLTFYFLFFEFHIKLKLNENFTNVLLSIGRLLSTISCIALSLVVITNQMLTILWHPPVFWGCSPQVVCTSSNNRFHTPSALNVPMFIAWKFFFHAHPWEFWRTLRWITPDAKEQGKVTKCKNKSSSVTLTAYHNKGTKRPF